LPELVEGLYYCNPSTRAARSGNKIYCLSLSKAYIYKLKRYNFIANDSNMSNSLSTINFNKFLTLISVSFLIFIGFFNIAHAGAVINKPPVTLGLISGLVGYWSFEDSEMTSNNAFDVSGNGNHGTLTNGPKKVIGKIGQALNFDGGDDVVNLGSPSALDNIGGSPGPRTITAWVYATGWGGGTLGRIYNNAPDNFTTTGTFFILSNGTGGAGPYYAIGSSDGSWTWAQGADGTVSLNQWVFLVGTWNGVMATAPKLYKNGVEVSYGASGGATGSYVSDAALTTYIGNRPNGQRGFQGLIDEVRVYNRALSASEIYRLYNMGR